MKIKLLAAATTLLIPGCLLSQVDQRPVPEKWLHDGKLSTTEFNFSIKAPTPDSTWTYAALPKSEGVSATAFFATTLADVKYVVLSFDKGGDVDSVRSKQFVDGMTRSLPKDWTITGTTFDSSDVPLRNSMRFRATMRMPNNSTIFMHGYVVPGKRIYMLVHYSTEMSEPLDFREFVGTFALLKPDPPDPSSTTNSLILLASIAGAIFDWWYMRKGGRKPVRNDYLGLLVVVLLVVALLVFYGYRGADAGKMGAMTANLLVLVFGVWELSRWIIRRKYPRPSTKPLYETINRR